MPCGLDPSVDVDNRGVSSKQATTQVSWARGPWEGHRALYSVVDWIVTVWTRYFSLIQAVLELLSSSCREHKQLPNPDFLDAFPKYFKFVACISGNVM